MAYETDAETAAAGVRAKLLLNQIQPRLDARVKQTVIEMCREFRTGSMSYPRALSYIASLAETVALIDSFEYEVRHGETAADRLHAAAKEENDRG